MNQSSPQQPLSWQAFSWQQSVWQSLLSAYRNNSLGHGLLFTGVAGLGKTQMALALGHLLLCNRGQSNGLTACGQCKSCALLTAGNHPDLVQLSPVGTAEIIKIDQIRYLIEQTSATAQQGRAKIMLLTPAEAMNEHASNALLKTLEEPPPDAFFILVSHHPHLLKATIRSRCQQIQIPTPSPQQGLQWLQQQGLQWLQQQGINGQQAQLALALSGNAPLQAKALLERDYLAFRQQILAQLVLAAQGDVLAINSKWQKDQMLDLLNLLYYCLIDMLKYRTGTANSVFINQDIQPALQSLAKKIKLNATFALIDQITASKKDFFSGVTLNYQMFAEDVLLKWRGLFA